MKSIIRAVLLLAIFGGSAKASNNGGNNDVAAVAFAGYALLTIFDIFSAPIAVRKYNEGLVTISPPLRRGRKAEESGVMFGQPFFSRTALVRNAQPAISPVSQERRTVGSARKKSEVAALFLSLGATAIPLYIGVKLSDANNGTMAELFIVSGLIVGPSVGHFYAGQSTRGVVTSLLRLGLGGLFLSTFEYYDD